MQRSQQEQPLEMSLREHLLAAAGTNASAPPPYPPPGPTQSQSHEMPYPRSEGSPREQQHHHLDPNVTGQQMPYGMPGDGGMDDGMGPNSAKGKRELSTSKRAAQNRAAQRAFRQRKEGYIKKLEEQVKDFQSMESNYKSLQNENYQLREYILNLQSRLLENQAEFPPAPSHINLSVAGGPPNQQQQHNPGDDGGPYQSAEQQLRREMGHDHDVEMDQSHHQHQHQQQTHPPPPAPVVAREDPAAVSRGGLEQLQAATAQQQDASPYGEYPRETPRKMDEEGKEEL